jgi:hypothetical protein
MMNSADVKAGTVTLETLLSSGWVEDDDMDPYIPANYRESLGRADGLLNTANEVPRSWDHSNVWTNDDGRIRQVRGHSRASATVYFTDLHGLTL